MIGKLCEQNSQSTRISPSGPAIAALSSCGKRATTHHASVDLLPRYEATPAPGRVVLVVLLVTAGGVTSGIDLGLYLVGWLYGDDARARIAARMEYPPPP